MHLARAPSLAFRVVFLALFASVPSLATAEVPRCEGTRDSEAIEREARLGREQYLRALRSRAGIDASAMREALQHFDAWCSAGDDGALEFRAYALRALGRNVDAAESLDAFVRRHPPATLPEAVRARLEANWSILESAVATLALSCANDGTRVRIDGRDYGTTPLRPVRLEPGTVLVELSREGFLTQSRWVHLARGRTQVESFSLVPATALHTPEPVTPVTPTQPEPVVVTPAQPPTQPPTPDPTPEPTPLTVPVLEVPLHHQQVDPRVLTLTPSETPAPAVPPTPPRVSMLPWILATAGTALVLGAAGVVPTVLQGACTQDPTCDRKGLLEGLQVGFFVSAGISLGASGILLLIDRAPQR